MAERELKLPEDWRLEFIRKNNPDAKTLFDVWRLFNLSKDKFSSWTEKEIKIQTVETDRGNFTYEIPHTSHQITEVCTYLFYDFHYY